MTYTEDLSSDENITFEDGQFNDPTKWNIGSQWFVGGGFATLNLIADINSALTQTRSELIIDNWYDITFTLANVFFQPAGGIKITCGNTWSVATAMANGTFTIRAQCGSLNQEIGFINNIALAPQSCDIDNVSIIAAGTAFLEQTGIDHRTPRAAVRYSVPDGDKIYHALSYKDKTNCMIKYTP